jgi:large subunit ribosomal protein L9
MKVILLERVGRMGHIGDEVNVKDGFARNFLLPQGKALRATEANRSRFERDRVDIEKRNTERREAAAGIAGGLNGRTVVMIRQAGETGQLYGSVSSRDIADALAAEGFSVTRGQINLMTPIKTIGMHAVPLNLHAEVEVTVNVNVARSDDEAERQARGEDLTVPSYERNENADLFGTAATAEGNEDQVPAPVDSDAGIEMERQRDA